MFIRKAVGFNSYSLTIKRSVENGFKLLNKLSESFGSLTTILGSVAYTLLQE